MRKYPDKERQRRCELVRRFSRSGLKKSEFCRQNGLPINSFDYWLRVAEQRDSPDLIEAEFVRVEVAGSESAEFEPASPDLEIDLPFGVKLRFFGIGAQER